MDINIFLASSSELKQDRDNFQKFITQLNEDWRQRDLNFKLTIWEDFIDSMSKSGLQNEYNKVAANCDIFIMLFFTKVGRYTIEEFESAYKQFQINGKPLIYTFFKEDYIYTGQIDENIISMLQFKKKLTDLKHYPTIYKSFEDLQWQISRQIEKLSKTVFSTGPIIRTKSKTDIDASTIENVCKLLSPQTDESTLENLRLILFDLIDHSSEFGKNAAFQLAKVNRRSNRINNTDLMARSIPIFRALIKSNKKNDRHYYYGQLAYALKDQGTGDWLKARENFDMAIEIRGGTDVEYFYEFNRIICKVVTDNNFQSSKKSTIVIKNQILQDLKYSKNGLGHQLKRIIDGEPANRVILKWMAINKISFNDL